MRWRKWIIVLLTVNVAGWMAFDGTRALIVGDYVTPSTGKYEGQLGPWHHVASAVGIAPRSTLMKTVFVVYGASWLAILAAFCFQLHWAWRAMVIAAAGSLWYFTIGTATSVIILVLLFLPRTRRSFSP